jgi:hypothetical protein
MEPLVGQRARKECHSHLKPSTKILDEVSAIPQKNGGATRNAEILYTLKALNSTPSGKEN